MKPNGLMARRMKRVFTYGDSGQWLLRTVFMMSSSPARSTAPHVAPELLRYVYDTRYGSPLGCVIRFAWTLETLGRLRSLMRRVRKARQPVSGRTSAGGVRLEPMETQRRLTARGSIVIVRGLLGLWLLIAGIAAQGGPIRVRPQVALADSLPDGSPIQSHSEIIERSRRMVRDYIDKLPNFICTRTTRTFWDWPGVEVEVASKTVVAEGRFVDGRESYSVVSVDGKPWEDPKDPRQNAIGGGLGSNLAQWFRPQAETQFKRSRDAMVRGRQAYVFQTANTGRMYVIFGGGVNPDGSYRLPAHVGFRGWVFIEKTSGNVLRMVAEETLGIPATHPVRQCSFRIDYDYVPISDSVHLLPVKQLIWWHMRNGWVIEDVIEYTGHRKFDAESSLTFSDSTPTSE